MPRIARSHRPASRASDGAVLALDTASPIVSVAIARPGGLLAERREELARSSVRLLEMIDGALVEAGVALAELAGVVVLAGPGSFTGLRIGMATALGFRQAAGVAATAVPTLEVLALLASGAGRSNVVAAVDVLRDEWAMQEFAPPSDPGAGPPGAPRPLGPPARIGSAELIARVRGAGALLVGFGTGRLAPRLGAAPSPLEPQALAAAAALAAARRPPTWDPGPLTAPLYFRPPAATPDPAAAARGATP